MDLGRSPLESSESRDESSVEVVGEPRLSSPHQESCAFGGRGSQGWLNDTWLWDGKTWSAVPGAGPSARAGANMAFDAISGYLILFGGNSEQSEMLSDTWAWDGKSWRVLSPSGRIDAAMAADPLGKIILLFGG